LTLGDKSGNNAIVEGSAVVGVMEKNAEICSDWRMGLRGFRVIQRTGCQEEECLFLLPLTAKSD
jgi:hypothetical protein